MASRKNLSAIALALLTTLAAAQQQSVLVDGISQLPACASSCALLQQASDACTATATSQQAAWVCFCQSGYLTSLRQSATAICPTECTTETDLTQISTWYSTNCGSDNGASEHQGGSAAAPSSNAAGGNGQASPTNAAAPATSTTSTASGSRAREPPGDWWSGHYQWIIMVLVLAIALPGLGFLGHWLKRRHDRRRDQNGFNTGITSRTVPGGQTDSAAGAVGSTGVHGSGRDSPARTRDAFMPYGYGYSRSDSRVGSARDRASPMPRDGTPDLEKDAAMAAAGGSDTEHSKRKSKRVLVRERSGADSIEAEKGSRH